LYDKKDVGRPVGSAHICMSYTGLLFVLTQALNVYGTLHLEALNFRRLVELLTATELLHYACLLKFSLEFLEGSFDVLALFYGYYNHFVVFYYFVITLFLSYIRALHAVL